MNQIQFRNLTWYKVALFIGLFFAASFFININAPEQVEASTCFDTPAERIGSLPIDTYFPRASLVKDPALGCAYLGSTETWSLLSSFYYIAPGTQSSLETGRSRFTLFAQGASAPAASQTIRIRWDDAVSRCTYGGWPSTSIVEVWAVDLHPGGGSYGWVNLGRIDDVAGADFKDFTINARWVNGGVKYGSNVWKSEMSIVVASSDFPNSTISCKIRAAALSGATITFHEQENQVPFGEPSQQWNWYNWDNFSTGGKHYLGPGDGSVFSQGSAYALYSDGGTARNLEYLLPFAASCDTPGATVTTRLRVYDMDNPIAGVFGPASPGPKQSRVPRMRLYDLDANIIIPVAGLPAGGEVNISNDEYAEYSAVIQTDRRYAWVFWDIQANNGVQVWMPYSEIHASVPCANGFDYTPEIFSSPANGTTRYPGQSIDILARNREINVGPGGTNYTMDIVPVGATASYVTRTVIPPGGVASGTDGVRFTRPGLAQNTYWNSGYPANSYARWTVNTNAPAGVNLCFYVRVTPNSSTNSAWQNSGQHCFTTSVNIYNYDPALPTAYSTEPLFYSGYTFDVAGRVTNVGNGTGPTYTQRFTMGLPTITGDPYQQTFAGLASGGSRVMDTRFTGRFGIPANTPHNTLVSCTNYVTPNTGLAPPSPFTGIGSVHEVTQNNCFRVENRRFNVPPLVSSDVTIAPSPALPSQPFTVNVTVCNDGTVPAGAQPDISRATRTTIAASTNVTASPPDVYTNDIAYGAGGCRTYVSNGWTVSSGAQLGELACVNVTVARQRGFSFPAPNGFNVVGSSTFQQCVDVAEQAYIEVANSSVWAGGSLDPSATGYGTSFCALPGNPSAGQIIGARLNGVGAWADYVTGAANSITNFGSAHINTGTVNGTGLTFANVGGQGLFGQGRCVTDLTTYLSDDTTRTGIFSLPGVNAWPTSSGQWVRNGNLTISGRTINAGDRFTIFVDGNVTITDDVVFGAYNVADKDLIPSLIIVATGDIDIQANVENLHGFYFAGDEIDTCSNQGSDLSSLVCVDHLTVVGSFVADDIQFRRTYGGVSGGNPNGGNSEAELFTFSPELYLANHILISETRPQLEIDQLLDLPPVIN